MRQMTCVLGPTVVAGLLVAGNPFTSSILAQAGTFTATASVKTSAGAQIDRADHRRRHPTDDRRGTRQRGRGAEEGRHPSRGAGAQGRP